MQVCIHRGAKEIGGSCVEVISAGKRIIIDLGLPLDAEKNDPKYLPEISGLDGKDNSLLAIIISHPHMDHFGLLTHISSEIPVIIGHDARNILTKASPFLRHNWTIPANGQDLVYKKRFELGPFRITPFLIDHSGYDSYSLLIEADGKRLFYSGDFRMHGRKSDLTERLMARPPKNIDVLLLEGSTLGRKETQVEFETETEVENRLASAFKNSKGLSLVHASSQNIDRIVSIFKACIKAKKTLVIDLYTAEILDATGNIKIPQSHWLHVALFVPQSQRVQIKENEWYETLNGHSNHRIYMEHIQKSPSDFVMLFRPIHITDFIGVDILKDASYIYSMWLGYWEKESFSNVRKWLEANRIVMEYIHTSGHAGVTDLQRFAVALKPARIVPFHTFKPENYIELFNHVEIHADGEYWEV